MKVKVKESCTVLSAHPLGPGGSALASLNQSAGHASLQTARHQRYINVRETDVHDEGCGGTSGQVGSDLGLITQLLEKERERNQRHIPSET